MLWSLGLQNRASCGSKHPTWTCIDATSQGKEENASWCVHCLTFPITADRSYFTITNDQYDLLITLKANKTLRYGCTDHQNEGLEINARLVIISCNISQAFTICHLRNKTFSPCLHSLVKSEANVWENSRADQWKPEMQSRVFTCSRACTNLPIIIGKSKRKKFFAWDVRENGSNISKKVAEGVLHSAMALQVATMHNEK